MPSVLRIKNPDGTWYEVTALKGDTGITPNLQVGTVTTGNPGTSAEVTITGTPEEPVLNFKIPKGEPGTGGDGGANIDDTTPSTSTTYSSSKIESKLTALNDANAALIEVSKTKPNAENTELWIHPNADEVQLPQIDDSVESEQDTWSSKKIAAEVSNKVNEKDLASVAKSGSYTDLTNQPTIPTVPSTLPNPNALTFTGAVNETYDGSAAKSVAIPTVPTTLPNPNKLILSGAVTAEYDGSAPVSVEIPSGGGSAYELPVASPTTLGGVKAAAKTDSMTQEIGVDADGRLWTMAGGGGNNNIEGTISTIASGTIPAGTAGKTIIDTGVTFGDMLKHKLVSVYLKTTTNCAYLVTFHANPTQYYHGAYITTDDSSAGYIALENCRKTMRAVSSRSGVYSTVPSGFGTTSNFVAGNNADVHNFINYLKPSESAKFKIIPFIAEEKTTPVDATWSVTAID